jgi:hypothetical protein
MQEHRGDIIQLATRIPQALHRAIRLRAVEEERPLGEFVSEAITEHLARVRGQPAPGPRPRKLTDLGATRRARPKPMPAPQTLPPVGQEGRK